MNAYIDPSIRKAALAARIWYVPLMVFAILGIAVADSQFYVPGDASETMRKIIDGESSFRLGIAGYLAAQVSQIFVMLALYRMFVSVDRDRARTLFALVVVMVPIAFINILNKFAPVVLFGDPALLEVFESGTARVLGMLFLELQRYGALIIDIFWGLWLIPLGILVYKSGWFPRVLGILLFIGCAGYIATSLTAFVPPAAGHVLKTAGDILAMGEVAFVLWFTVLGIRARSGKTGNKSSIDKSD